MTEQAILGVPRVPEGMASRANLAERLGRSPLTVIRAPGGRGKTTLMAQWAESQTRPGAWVTVDSSTGDRTGFWRAVADAMRLPQQASDPEEVIRALRGGPRPFVLVVDDAHHLRDASIADDLVSVLRAARDVSMIVSTRSRLPLESASTVLTLDVEVLAPDELLFDVDEIEQLLAAGPSEKVSAADLREASGGSALILRAMLAGSPTMSPASIVRSHVARLLARADAEFSAFVSVTAMPEDFDPVAAKHLSGLDASRVASLIGRLESEGLVTARDESAAPRFHFHPLVREALRDGLRREHPAEFRRASLLASADAEARKLFSAALRHAVDAEDYVRASDVVLHGGFALIRARGAAEIIERVPMRYVARLPFLAVVLGLAANIRGERLRAVELLTVALAASRAGRSRQRVAERAGLALVETIVLRITGNATDAVSAARRVLSLLDEAAPADLEEIADQLRPYRYQAAVSLFRAGRFSEARDAAERVGFSQPAPGPRDPESLGAAALVTLVDAARGDNTSASSMIARIDAAGFPDDLDAYVGAPANLARGILALESNDPARAFELAQQYRARENLEYTMQFTLLRSMVSLWRGEAELGMSTLDDRETSDGSRARLAPEDRRLIAAARVLLSAALGEVGGALVRLRQLDKGDALTGVLHAALLLQQQEPARVIERLSATAGPSGPRLTAAGDLLTASASLGRADRVLAEAALRRFLAIREVHAVSSPVILIPAESRDALWSFAAEIGVPADDIAALRVFPAPLRLAAHPVVLTPREEEVLHRLRDTASLAEIAAAITVSPNTVKTQVRTLYRKLGVANREEALRAARLHGLLRD